MNVTGSTLVIDTLKRELKARGMTYAQLAPHIGLSEAGVKRMFSTRTLTLERVDAICAVLGIDFVELTRRLAPEERLITQLTRAQEEAIVADPTLFLVAVCALHCMSVEQITAIYDISLAECLRCLMRLDRIGFLRVQPGNRVRLLVARSFHWIPEGPIARYFKRECGDYFASAFDAPDEVMRVVNLRLSKTARAALLARLQQLARELSDQHNLDARLPLGERQPVSLLFAVRSWEPPFMRARRRLSDEALAAYVRAAPQGATLKEAKQADRPDSVSARA